MTQLKIKLKNHISFTLKDFQKISPVRSAGRVLKILKALIFCLTSQAALMNALVVISLTHQMGEHHHILMAQSAAEVYPEAKKANEARRSYFNAHMTSKKKQIAVSFGGCSAGLALGAVLALDAGSDRADRPATLATNTAIGCALGILAGWIFVEDDQTFLYQNIDKLSFELGEAQKIIRKENYKRLGSKSDLKSSLFFEGDSSSLHLPKNQVPAPQSLQSFDFDGYKAAAGEKHCLVGAFRLMANGKDYVPVSDNIIMPNHFYYLIAEDQFGSGENKGPCVRPDLRFGHLEDIITGLGSALHNAADDAAQDYLRQFKKNSP